MKYITEKMIDEAEEAFSEMSDEKFEKFMGRFTEEQPFILVYLMASGDELSQVEQENLMFLGFKVWYILLHNTGDLPQIPDKKIDEVEEQNIKMLEYFASESEEGFAENVEILLQNYAQKDLLSYVIMNILEEEDDDFEVEIEPENQGVFFTTLKVVLECFDN